MRLIVENVEKSFGAKRVLRQADAVFEQGEICGLLGRNGAGKTTLFSIIAGNLEAEKGSVWLEEEGQRRALQPEDLFFMVAEPSLPNFLTGRELIRFFIDVNRKEIQNLQTEDAYFDWIQFEEEDRDRLIQEYSTGMKNKLQMLMFLILRPRVILMDEPLTSLDVVVQLELKKLIRSIRSEHIILLSTHILQLAEDLCDRIVLLVDGKMEAADALQSKENKDAFEDRLIARLLEKNPEAELQTDSALKLENPVGSEPKSCLSEKQREDA
uniref:ABC transporter ATP-binding protein n=1 Tax=Ndongobacter massiliensis TaxID=1871025 RepID=UPI0009315EA3|nr:ATP-binding cassette domain-containing protein [Ndongobacter massiliensis]